MTEVFFGQQKRPIPEPIWQETVNKLENLAKYFNAKNAELKTVTFSFGSMQHPFAKRIVAIYNEYFAEKKESDGCYPCIRRAMEVMRKIATNGQPIIFDTENLFKTYAVYLNPKDYPGKYVVRCFFTENGANPIAFNIPYLVTDDLSEITEAMLKMGLIATAPSPIDDPVIKMVFI